MQKSKGLVSPYIPMLRANGGLPSGSAKRNNQQTAIPVPMNTVNGCHHFCAARPFDPSTPTCYKTSICACPGAQSCRRFAGGIEVQLGRSEEHTSELQSRRDLVCRLLLEKK